MGLSLFLDCSARLVRLRSAFLECLNTPGQKAVNEVAILDRESHLLTPWLIEAVNANPKDSDIFTALSPNHKYFPPTYICTCGADPLRDDGTVIGHALTKAGFVLSFLSTPFSEI